MLIFLASRVQSEDNMLCNHKTFTCWVTDEMSVNALKQKQRRRVKTQRERLFFSSLYTDTVSPVYGNRVLLRTAIKNYPGLMRREQVFLNCAQSEDVWALVDFVRRASWDARFNNSQWGEDAPVSWLLWVYRRDISWGVVKALEACGIFQMWDFI
jgi:hypothetical protein